LFCTRFAWFGQDRAILAARAVTTLVDQRSAPGRSTPAALRLLWAGIYLQVSTQPVLFLMPLLVEGLTRQFPMSPLRIGYLSVAIIGVLTVSNLVCAILTKWLPWATTAFIASVLMVVGNGLAAVSHDFSWVLIFCVVASVGNGVMTSIGTSAIGVSGAPERHFGITFLLIAGSAMLPSDHTAELASHEVKAVAQSVLGMSKAFSLGLFGIFLIYGGLQLMLTYAVVYAVSSGLSVGFASYSLSAVAVFSILGSLLSAMTARVGHLIGTQIGVVFSIAGRRPTDELRGKFVPTQNNFGGTVGMYGRRSSC
jgi:hypothetical protein